MSKTTGSGRVIQPPIGADQRAKWKAVIAANHKRQRAERARGYRPRKRGIDAVTTPGMIRVRPGKEAS